MRKHLILVVVVMVVTVSLFAAWFVRFLDDMLIQQSSSQVLNMTGQVESSQSLSEWSEVSLDQTILPNTYLRTSDESTVTIWLDPVSRLVLQPNTQVHYVGFQNGSPIWQVVTGTINGRFAHPSYPDRSLTLRLNQSELAISQATFQARNELTEKSVTAYDQPLVIHLGTTSDSELAQTITVQPGETYTFTVSDQTTPVAETTTTPSDQQSSAIDDSTDETIATTSAIATTQIPDAVLPESLQDFVVPATTNALNLTIGATQPLTFLWNESSSTATKQSYRIFRSKTTPLDEESADGYRTTTGTQHMSYSWPLPSTNTTFHFRVCRLKNNHCDSWSNTITIPAGTFSQ